MSDTPKPQFSIGHKNKWYEWKVYYMNLVDIRFALVSAKTYCPVIDLEHRDVEHRDVEHRDVEHRDISLKKL